MSVISIFITESPEQIVSGIPKTVTLATNIPASIFYTLDGTVPNLFSTIYTSHIVLPTNLVSVTLNILATDGVNYSPVITEFYAPDILNNTRLPHSPTDVNSTPKPEDLYPFGDGPLNPNGIFLNPAEAGVTVNDPSLPSTPTGFDGDGYEAGFTNKPYNLQNYDIFYDVKNAEGENGRENSTLPAEVTVPPEPSIPLETKQYSTTFDPRAFVIFQDFTKSGSTDPTIVNRHFFSLENSEKIRDGNNFFNSGLDAPPVTGAFVKAFYNPIDNTDTYYYYDNLAGRWIISKAPHNNFGFDGNLSMMPSGRDNGGVGRVIEWTMFQRRVLF